VARPDVRFEPPSLNAGNVHKPVVFEANVMAILPTATPYTVELVLKAEGGLDRTLRMEGADGKYRVTAAALPPPQGAAVLQLAAQFKNGSMNATVADAKFKVGDRTVTFGEVRLIETTPKPRVWLHDGTSVDGPATGLNAVPVRFGEQSTTIDLSQASEVKFAAALESDQITCTLVVRQGDKEVQRLSESAIIQGVRSVSVARVGRTGIKPPVFDGPKVERKLTSTVADVAVGGAGRYLVLHLPAVRKLAVFDVNTANVSGYIPLAEADVKFAAGQDEVVVLRPAAGTIERWNLKSFARTATAPLPLKGTIKAVAMGCASKGPLLVHGAVGTAALDRGYFAVINVETLKPIRGEFTAPQMSMLGMSYRDQVHLRASANGTTFGAWCSSHSPSGLGTFIVSGDRVAGYYAHSSVGHVLPGPDGRTVFTRSGQYAPEVNLMDQGRPGNALLPAYHGEWYLSLPYIAAPNNPRAPRPTGADTVATIRVREKVIATLRAIDLKMPNEDFLAHDFTFDKRVHLIPDARLVITIPLTNDSVILHRIEDAAETGGATSAGSTNGISKIALYVGADGKPGMFVCDGGAWSEHTASGAVNKYVLVTGSGNGFIHLKREGEESFVRLYKAEAYQSSKKEDKGARRLYQLYWCKGDVK
jgi:hypothetical protein